MSDSFATPWTRAQQAPLSLESPRQEYWSGLPLLSPGDIPDPRIEPTSPAWQADSLPLSHLGEMTCNPAGSRKVDELGVARSLVMSTWD